MNALTFRPRQTIGWFYIAMYIAIALGYALVLEDERSWAGDPKFTATVVIWFVVSLAVKVSMAVDRVVELLNVAAMAAFLSVGFTYHPIPGYHNAIQTFGYYLYLVGGPACDLFDFIYNGAAGHPEDRPARPE